MDECLPGHLSVGTHSIGTPYHFMVNYTGSRCALTHVRSLPEVFGDLAVRGGVGGRKVAGHRGNSPIKAGVRIAVREHDPVQYVWDYFIGVGPMGG